MSPDEFKAARDALGMSTTELAEWLGLDGAHGRTMIREMESGKRSISGPIRRALTLAMEQRWRLIETVPIDRTPVLLLSPEGHVGLGVLGEWEMDGLGGVSGQAAWSGERSHIVGNSVWLGRFGPEEATHWMPAPTVL